MDLYLIIYSLDKFKLFKLQKILEIEMFEHSFENILLFIGFICCYLYNRKLKMDLNMRKNFIYKVFKINKNSSAYPIIKRQVELSNM